MRKIILSTLLFCSILNLVATKDLPAFIKKCDMNDKHLKNCLKQSIESLQPYLRKGIPSLNIPSVDPLTIPLIALQNEMFTANYTNVTIYNAYKFNIAHMDVDTDELSFNLIINFQNIKATMKYVAKGQALVLYIDGSGDAALLSDDVDLKLHLRLNKVVKNNKTYFDVKYLKVDVIPNKLFIIADDIINGNPKLSRQVMALMNQNVLDFYEVPKPAFNKAAEEIFMSVFSHVFSKWSVDELFN